MLDERAEVLYVGKARNLRQRVASYFRENHASAKTRSLVAHIRAIEVTVTHTEAEALILESTLIKEYKPRYNILLRDDKGYPYIHVSDGDFPDSSLHRGAKRAPGRYFGPYPNANAVRDTLNLLQKVFRLRPCEDSFFRGRSRPCLQYQIKRCTAPCVGLIGRERLRGSNVHDAVLFLEGKSGQVIAAIGAANGSGGGGIEFRGCGGLPRPDRRTAPDSAAPACRAGERRCSMWLPCAVRERGGLRAGVCAFAAVALLGNKASFPRLPEDEDAATVQDAFLAQYYLDKDVPAEILISPEPVDAALLARAFSEQCWPTRRHHGPPCVVNGHVGWKWRNAMPSTR
ncbi:MAG: GIY-YIG nuclease family protein [Chromatiales bacterium]|nr:GIY-YIG nuclease family protein [Chromatiales bacterium]